MLYLLSYPGCPRTGFAPATFGSCSFSGIRLGASLEHVRLLAAEPMSRRQGLGETVLPSATRPQPRVTEKRGWRDSNPRCPCGHRGIEILVVPPAFAATSAQLSNVGRSPPASDDNRWRNAALPTELQPHNAAQVELAGLEPATCSFAGIRRITTSGRS
jgi:hypothetical protein